ncbi:DUF1223 domain-containing protein, partial [Rhizobium leguminosarum]|uniref:DUF1223 domain-containing protein n=1 Tax=Rhizobium leguminosarum TaxID=384 RepID=UPI003F9B7DEC
SPRFLIPLIAGVVLSGPLQAEDGTPKGVVELFTSQGCSSCPPADAAFLKLVNQGDVIALAYHVDYWNYLGIAILPLGVFLGAQRIGPAEIV